MNMDQTLERAQRVATIAALIGFAIAAVTLASPQARTAAQAKPAPVWHAVQARRAIQPNCLVLAFDGEQFAACGD